MIIKNKTSGKTLATNVLWCNTFTSKARGLMFKRIKSDDACVLVNKNDSLLDSGIHMVFVPQPLKVLWVNSDFVVVSVKHCPKANPFNWWRVYYPAKPAKYVIELIDSKGTLVGDELRFQ